MNYKNVFACLVDLIDAQYQLLMDGIGPWEDVDIIDRIELMEELCLVSFEMQHELYVGIND